MEPCASFLVSTLSQGQKHKIGRHLNYPIHHDIFYCLFIMRVDVLRHLSTKINLET